jgi:hypothetical protein
LEFHHVLRDYNVAADVLSKLGSKRALVPAEVIVQTKLDLAPAEGQEVLVIESD